MRLCPNKAQSVGEYALIIAVIASLLMGMQVYIRRGLQARIKDGSDSAIAMINGKLGAGFSNQFEPTQRESTGVTIGDSVISQNMEEEGRLIKQYHKDNTQVHAKDTIR